jgi:hypothetical protein
MKKTTIVLSVLSLFFFMSCQKASNLEFSVNDPSSFSLDPNQQVTFAEIKSTILKPHCLSCHSSIGTESNLKNWITPGSPERSLLFTSIENGSMPKNQSPLDTKSLELIRNYINQMGTTNVPIPGAAGITYAQIKTAVLSPYRCLNCHSVGTEVQLAKWINTSNPSRSTFYTYILSGSMPPSGSSPSAEIEALVLEYVTEFANR